VEKSAARNGTACEKAVTAGHQLNQQLESLEGFSRQLGELIDGVSLKVTAPAPVGASAPQESASVHKPVPARASSEEPAEKTGTDGTKVIRLNNS